MNQILATLYQQESRRVLATLIRLLGSFDVAEDALHDAFIAASEQWPSRGVPANPVAWLISTGRFKAIDRIRRERRFVASEVAVEQAAAVVDDTPGWEQRWDEREAIDDDRLRLIFTCRRPVPPLRPATRCAGILPCRRGLGAARARASLSVA